MKKRFGYVLIILFIFGCHVSFLSGQGLVLKKNIIVEEDQVQDNLLTFGGNILIKGKVRENVVAFGGTIIVEGEVGELVLGLGTDITLRSSAKIQGDVISLGGTLEKEAGVFISGDTIFFNFETGEDIKKFFREGLGGIFGISLIPFFLVVKLITLFIWFVLALILIAIFPQQISGAATMIRKSFWPIFGIGFLSLIVYAGMILFSALLSIILIGIPILLALIFLGIAVKVFGQVVIFYFFGESLYRTFSKKQPTPLPAVLLGFLLVGLIGFIPIIGSLFSLVISVMGWGVVIKTRFGSKSIYSQKKLPAEIT
jgi:hypothetical protein